MAEQNIRLPEKSRLIVSSSPHLHENDNIRRIMAIVTVALLPACAVGVIMFGWQAFLVLAWTVLFCVGIEHLACRLRGTPSTVGNLSAVVTGLLLGMCLPASAPWWLCLIGSILAIGLGKQIYGGLGYNPFNPALVGRVGLIISFPALMASAAWVKAQPGKFYSPLEAITSPTPLGDLQDNGIAGTDYMDYFLGNMAGSIGETSALALLLGGLLLVYFGYIRWQVPAGFLGSLFLITGIAWIINPTGLAPPHFHILTGGAMLGAWFMATDMTTSPIGKRGAFVFGAGCGIITAVIRLWGNLPEGVSFSILFMNGLVPLLDRYISKKPFGYKKAG